MPKQRPSVSEAATTCLAFCSDSPNRTTIISLFLERLRKLPEWTEAEVDAVARLIDERLKVSPSPLNVACVNGDETP